MAKATKKPLSRSEIMARVKSADTGIEVPLRKILWSKGLRYRKNYRKVKGAPDIAFPGLKIAVFCDSEFWHGKYYKEDGSLPKGNREYWRKKFEKNIARDEEVTKTLENDGWLVLRFWEKEIRADTEGVAEKIIEAVKSRKRNKI